MNVPHRPGYPTGRRAQQSARFTSGTVLMFLLGLLPLLVGCPASAYIRLTHIRPGSSPTLTQVVVTVDGPVQTQVGRLSQPDRLFVDFYNTRLPRGWDIRQIDVNDGRLQTIRVGQNQPNTVRIVLDLQQFRDYRIVSEERPSRVVINLYGDSSGGAEATRPPKPSRPPVTIVIDPGHGGKDPGAIGPGGLEEKTVVLQVGKFLQQIIHQNLPDVNAVMTRDSDVFIPLTERARIANALQARLFVSLHLNASRNHEAHGIETWYLSFAANERAKKTAARENMMSEAQLSDLEIILRDLHETDRINQSAILAGVIQGHLVKFMERYYPEVQDRGVEGAPFVVLLHTAMPSILGELGFVSNPHEEERLRTSAYQLELAQGVFEGIQRFLQTAVVASE